MRSPGSSPPRTGAFEVVLHVRGDGDDARRRHPDPGRGVIERIAPHAFLRALIHDAEGRPVNASGRHRHPTTRQTARREERDRGCVDCGSNEPDRTRPRPRLRDHRTHRRRRAGAAMRTVPPPSPSGGLTRSDSPGPGDPFGDLAELQAPRACAERVPAVRSNSIRPARIACAWAAGPSRSGRASPDRTAMVTSTSNPGRSGTPTASPRRPPPTRTAAGRRRTGSQHGAASGRGTRSCRPVGGSTRPAAGRPAPRAAGRRTSTSPPTTPSPNDDRHELLAGGCQQVVPVESFDQPGSFELTQPLGQQRPRQPGHAACDVVEPLGARQHVPQDQDRPPLPQHLDRPGDRAVLAVGQRDLAG